MQSSRIAQKSTNDEGETAYNWLGLVTSVRAVPHLDNGPFSPTKFRQTFANVTAPQERVVFKHFSKVERNSDEIGKIIPSSRNSKCEGSGK